MYIVSRRRGINPARGRAAVAAAIEAGSRASDKLGMPVFVWSSLFSSAGGEVSWSCRVDHLADAVAIDDTLFADDDFAQWAEDNDGLFVGPAADGIWQVLHAAPTGPPKQYLQATSAVCANGSMSEGMAVGVEVAEAVGSITGIPVMFLSSVTGVFGAVGWLSTVDDLADAEAADAKLAADNDWLKLLDRAGHVYAPGTASAMMRRIG
jgi:hypothetical protein